MFGRVPKNFIPGWESSKTSPDGQQSHAAFLRNVGLIPAGIIQQAFNKIWAGIAERNEPDSSRVRALLFLRLSRAGLKPRALCGPVVSGGIPSHPKEFGVGENCDSVGPLNSDPQGGVAIPIGSLLASG